MIGLGTIVNCVAVAIGCLIGFVIKKGLSERFEYILMKALGLSTMFIGAAGTLSGIISVEDGKFNMSLSSIMLMIISLVIGSVVGEALRIEDCLDSLGEKIKKRVKGGENNARFVEGFVTNTVLICVGAMAIVGSLNDGLRGDASTLYVKSTLDFVSGIVLTSTLGIGTIFAVLPMGIYQGAITVVARFIEPYLPDVLISDIDYIGSVLIFAIGINLAFGKKFKTGNMLPAILVPVVWRLLLQKFF